MSSSIKTASLVFLALLATACGPSLSDLQANARRGEVAAHAAIHARKEIRIEAPVDVVWALLADVRHWPEWQPNISQVRVPDAVASDTKFEWVNDGTTIHSQMALVEPSSRLAWTGSVAMAKAVHVWRLSSPSPGVTVVEVEESMDGPLLTAFYGEKQLSAELVRSLSNLARAAESKQKT